MSLGTVHALDGMPDGQPVQALENDPMNLREVQLSSRSVIPVALALPINREPADLHLQVESMRRQREAAAASEESGPKRRAVSFYL